MGPTTLDTGGAGTDARRAPEIDDDPPSHLSFVVTKTPHRISFFGGGSDYPAWYREHGGAVLSTSIDKYIYITCRYLPPFFPATHRVVWAHIETVASIKEILHPAVRVGLQMLGFTDDKGVEIMYQGDIPARTGMGSSSAFANGLLLGLNALRGQQIDKHALYSQTIHLEQDELGDNVGSQDQVATAVGGLNVIRFATDGGIAVEPVAFDADRRRALNRNLMLFYVGGSRLGSTAAASTIASFGRRAAHVRRMHQMVDEGAAILSSPTADLDDFGRMLDEAWRLKRELSDDISNTTIDDIYARGLAAGALGGKLLGAGSTGFMLFYVPRDRQAAVRDALGSLLHVPFRFETDGCKLMHA